MSIIDICIHFLYVPYPCICMNIYTCMYIYFDRGQSTGFTIRLYMIYIIILQVCSYFPFPYSLTTLQMLPITFWHFQSVFRSTGLCFHSCFPLQLYRYGLLLQQATPPHICVTDLGRRIACLPGVQAVHDLHVWQLTESLIVASVHLHCYTGFPAHR